MLNKLQGQPESYDKKYDYIPTVPVIACPSTPTYTVLDLNIVSEGHLVLGPMELFAKQILPLERSR